MFEKVRVVAQTDWPKHTDKSIVSCLINLCLRGQRCEKKSKVSCIDLSPFSVEQREMPEEGTVSDFILMHYYLLLYFVIHCFSALQVL